MSQDKTPHGQNVTGHKATRTKFRRTKRHMDIMSQDIKPLRQNATQTKCHMDKISKRKTSSFAICVSKNDYHDVIATLKAVKILILSQDQIVFRNQRPKNVLKHCKPPFPLKKSSTICTYLGKKRLIMTSQSPSIGQI